MSIDLAPIAERQSVRIRWVVKHLGLEQTQTNRTLVWIQMRREGWKREPVPYDGYGARWLNPRWHQ